MYKTTLALLLAILLGVSLSCLPHPTFSLRWEFWAALGSACFVGIVLCLSFSFAKGGGGQGDGLKKEMERFEQEFKLALRGHLKVSILFWIHFYKKEKVKTFEDAKKEVFQDLKREFIHLSWMDSILEEIRQELARYK